MTFLELVLAMLSVIALLFLVNLIFSFKKLDEIQKLLHVLIFIVGISPAIMYWTIKLII